MIYNRQAIYGRRYLENMKDFLQNRLNGTSIEENEFKYIVGIDDGIKTKGILRENVKDYMRDIIND